MKTLIVFLCMAGAALAQQRRQQEPPPTDRASLGKVKGKELVDVTVKTGTEIMFDDNILELNNKQVKELEDGSKPLKYRIDQPDDFVYSVFAEIKLKGKFIGDTSHLELKVQPFFYQSSSIANYEEYDLVLRQDLGRHEAGIEYEFDHDVYLRELKHTVTTPSFITTTTWESARYMEHNLEPYYRHQLNDALGLRGAVGYRMKDFNTMFDFRDIDGYFVSFGPVVTLGRGISAYVKYEYSAMNAEASSADPDTSYRQHEFELGGSVEPIKSLEFSLKYRVALRDYTTHNDPAVDPSHADRDDLRQKLVFRARWKISKSWSVRLEYVYRQVDSHRPFDDNATTSEPGDAVRNVVSIGATFTF